MTVSAAPQQLFSLLLLQGSVADDIDRVGWVRCIGTYAALLTNIRYRYTYLKTDKNDRH